MKYVEDHNIVILEDKDYQDNESIKLGVSKFDYLKSRIKTHCGFFECLLKADLKKLFNMDEDYFSCLIDRGYLYGFYPDLEKIPSILCPKCFSNVFEAVKKGYIPIGIDEKNYKLIEDNEKELIWDDHIKIYCCKCGGTYNLPKE